jgi:hypothetical protein
MKEGVKPHNVRTDHVVIRSELHNLIGDILDNFKYQVFGGKTTPFPMVRVFGGVRRIAMVHIRV